MENRFKLAGALGAAYIHSKQYNRDEAIQQDKLAQTLAQFKSNQAKRARLFAFTIRVT